jgi:hypothetical protein
LHEGLFGLLHEFRELWWWGALCVCLLGGLDLGGYITCWESVVAVGSGGIGYQILE